MPLVFGLLMSLAQAVFSPPVLVSGGPPGLPPVTVLGGGEVLVEATIERNGVLSHPILLRNTPPYGQMVVDAIKGWRFKAARVPGPDGSEETAVAPILVAAAYRPPTVYNGPTLGTAPVDLSRASAETPYPVTMPVPAYPPQARFGGIVMLELSLAESGRVTAVRIVSSDPAFDAAARDAVGQWAFRGASVKGRAVRSTAYVIFGFMPPVTGK